MMVVLAFAVSGCGASVAAGGTSAPPAPAPQAPTRTATPADAQFMTAMIHHHAQALEMAAMAQTHGANPSIQTLADRITVAQNDEIALIQLWLTDHGLPVPQIAPTRAPMTAGGAERHMHMAGMLTPEQMDELDRARGREFDRLFLTFMIQHHDGALTMVDELFASYGGGVDDFIYKFANDTFADQGSEIDRMVRMLEAMQAP